MHQMPNVSRKSKASSCERKRKASRTMFEKTLPLIVVCSISIEHCVAAEEVGFEPRDSFLKTFTKKSLENPELSLSEDNTDTPAELEAPEGAGSQLCELCAKCLQCTGKVREASLPEDLLQDADLMVFHSFQGDKVSRGLGAYVNEDLDSDLRRAGLAPMRLWVSKCTIVISMLRGAFPACNCDPPPDSYQLYIDGVGHIFRRNLNFWPCKLSDGLCTIQAQDSMGSVYFSIEDQADTMLLASKQSHTYMEVPAFNLTIFYQQVTHKGGQKETFFAVSKSDLQNLAKSFVDIQVKKNEHFGDLGQFLLAKLTGEEKACFPIGKKEQTLHSFDEFLKLPKT